MSKTSRGDDPIVQTRTVDDTFAPAVCERICDCGKRFPGHTLRKLRPLEIVRSKPVVMNRVPASRYVVFFLIAGSGTTLDLWSKSHVFNRLGAPHGSSGWLIDSWLKFELNTSFNTGALWGVGQGMAWLFALLSVGAFIAVLYWLFAAKAARDLTLTITLAMITAGTLGNLYDRLALHGWRVDEATRQVFHADAGAQNAELGTPLQAVRDFLHFRFGTFDWATFNVADILLVVGAIMLGLHSFRKPVVTPDGATETGPATT